MEIIHVANPVTETNGTGIPFKGEHTIGNAASHYFIVSAVTRTGNMARCRHLDGNQDLTGFIHLPEDGYSVEEGGKMKKNTALIVQSKNPDSEQYLIPKAFRSLLTEG